MKRDLEIQLTDPTRGQDASSSGYAAIRGHVSITGVLILFSKSLYDLGHYRLLAVLFWTALDTFSCGPVSFVSLCNS